MQSDRETLSMEIESFDEKDCTKQNWSGWAGEKRVHGQPARRKSGCKDSSILSLHDASSRIVAQTLPFELVQNYFPPIPEHSQVRIAFYSFPTSVSEIRLYSVIGNGQLDEFERASCLVQQAQSVKNAIQIGFHLSAQIIDVDFRMKPTTYQVRLFYILGQRE